MSAIQAGYRTGILTVEEATDQRKNGYTIWRCRCDCGGEILLDTRRLQRQTVKDCGCRVKTKPGQRNLAGMRFGRLVAIEPTQARGKSGGTVWRCRCDCGNEALAVSTQLTQGFKKSCGCWSHPELKDYVGKKFSGLTVTEYAGKADGKHRWKCRCDCGREIIVDQSNLQSGHAKSCGCLQSLALRNTLQLIDGTSVNLLMAHRKNLLPGNKSGYTGVYQNAKGKWTAQITFKGKTYYLGSYADKTDAVRARKRGEEMHDAFLQWYYLEHLKMQELPKDVQELLRM